VQSHRRYFLLPIFSCHPISVPLHPVHSPCIHDADPHLSISASEADVDKAVTAARTAFRTTWGKNVTGFERARLLHKLADLIERDAEILGQLECLNNGKPFRIARYRLHFILSSAEIAYSGAPGILTSVTASVASAITPDGRTRSSARYVHFPFGVCPSLR
jgi:acyl-CoA reductase-like NAD-dependent aldehyde dehydrogenase